MVESQVLTALREAIGNDAVIIDPEALAETSHDTWPVATKWFLQDYHPYPADVLVRATSEAGIARILAIANDAGIPVTPRSLGSSVTGQPIPVRGGLVLDLSGLTGDFELDDEDMTVTAPAGNNGGELENALNEAGWTMRFSPQSLYRSSIGGWLATLATGQFSSRYGGIEDMVVGYRVVLADGTATDLKASPRAAMGPDLRRLFIGSEGTLGVVTRVTCRIFPIPENQQLQALELPDIQSGLNMMRKIMAAGMKPFLVRFYDAEEACHALGDRTQTRPVLFLGTEGYKRLAEAEMQVLEDIGAEHNGRIMGPKPVESWMRHRFDFSTIESYLNTTGGFAETIEVAHTWRNIRRLHAELKVGLTPLADEVMAHFSHVYTQGTSMYLIVLGQTTGDEAATQRLEQIWATAMRICLDHGAELSHHHGGGLARSPYARRSLGSAHSLLRKLKRALDPEGILNPGKLGI